MKSQSTRFFPILLKIVHSLSGRTLPYAHQIITHIHTPKQISNNENDFPYPLRWRTQMAVHYHRHHHRNHPSTTMRTTTAVAVAMPNAFECQ